MIVFGPIVHREDLDIIDVQTFAKNYSQLWEQLEVLVKKGMCENFSSSKDEKAYLQNIELYSGDFFLELLKLLKCLLEYIKQFMKTTKTSIQILSGN